MKKLFFIPVILMGLVACSRATDKDYGAMAGDFCECLTELTSGLSPGMVETVISAEKEGRDIDLAIREYRLDNLQEGNRDTEIMNEAGLKMESVCVKQLQEKYRNIYTSDSKEEVRKKLMKAFKNQNGCEFTYAIMKMGIEAE